MAISISRRNLDWVSNLTTTPSHGCGVRGNMADRYRYEEFTWPEVREAVAQNRVAVLPVGTIEQHGPHLPLITDVLTATEMSRRAVAEIPTEAVLLPPVFYAFNEHHLDFPGTISVRGETFVQYVTD